MAASPFTSALKSPSSQFMASPFCSKLLSHTLNPFRPQIMAAFPRRPAAAVSVRAQTLDFSGTFFDGGTAVEEREKPQCPPGLRQYGSMAVLRAHPQVRGAGGGMYVEVFNKGVRALAYSIKKKNKAGESITYLDGIHLLFTYYTKAESVEPLKAAMKTDDDVFRSLTIKVRKRKY